MPANPYLMAAAASLPLSATLLLIAYSATAEGRAFVGNIARLVKLGPAGAAEAARKAKEKAAELARKADEVRHRRAVELAQASRPDVRVTTPPVTVTTPPVNVTLPEIRLPDFTPPPTIVNIENRIPSFSSPPTGPTTPDEPATITAAMVEPKLDDLLRAAYPDNASSRSFYRARTSAQPVADILNGDAPLQGTAYGSAAILPIGIDRARRIVLGHETVPEDAPTPTPSPPTGGDSAMADMLNGLGIPAGDWHRVITTVLLSDGCIRPLRRAPWVEFESLSCAESLGETVGRTGAKAARVITNYLVGVAEFTLQQPSYYVHFLERMAVGVYDEYTNIPLETLRENQRNAFNPFREVADAVGRTPENIRQLGRDLRAYMERDPLMRRLF